MARDGRRPIDPVRLRANQRERALDRLSRLTTGAALAGTFATVGFGGLAAITYSGTPTATDPATVDDSTQATTPQTNSTNPSNNTVPSATQQPGTHQFVPAQPPTVTTRRRTHVSSGGS